MADRLAEADLVHATVVARRMGGEWLGVLLTGPSGSGKSDLALRLMDRGWRLVGDDYCRVWPSDGRLFVAADPRIAGRIEARGIGVIEAGATRPVARLVLAVACLQTPPERMPEPRTTTVAGIVLPECAIDTRAASAVLLLEHTLATLRRL